jgi:hypothetical protein
VAASRVSLEELVVAGRELFGPGFRVDRAGWRDDLKAVYRRRALETHPDRARAMGRSEAELAREFERVSRAYRVLAAWNLPPTARAAAAPFRPASVACAAPSGSPHAAHARSAPFGASSAAHARPAAPRPRPTAPPAADPQAAALPRRKLRLAEYLYYSGRISWSALTDAVAWQRKQRPAIGRLAVTAGYLTAEQVARLLDRRRLAGEQGVPLGEYAVRHGVLTQFQRLALLGRQIRLQRRIGEYFVEQGLVAPEELDELRRRIAWHNVRQGAGAEG